MALRRGKQDGDSEKWLEVDASMTGTLTFKDPVNLQINGQFEGTLDTKGRLRIGGAATVKATIRGEEITIAGSVEGDVTATQRLELSAGARLTGKVRSPRVIMQDGAILQGTLEMAGTGGTNSWMTIGELARYLEVDDDTITQWAEGGRLPAVRDGSTWRFERTKIEGWLAQEKTK